MMKIMKFGRVTAAFVGLTIVAAACTASTQAPTQPTARPTVQQPDLPTTDSPIQPTAKPTVQQTDNQPTEKPFMVELPDLGKAPEIENEVWVNVEIPVTLVSSQGKVVLLEFWTFG